MLLAINNWIQFCFRRSRWKTNHNRCSAQIFVLLINIADGRTTQLFLVETTIGVRCKNVKRKLVVRFTDTIDTKSIISRYRRQLKRTAKTCILIDRFRFFLKIFVSIWYYGYRFRNCHSLDAGFPELVRRRYSASEIPLLQMYINIIIIWCLLEKHDRVLDVRLVGLCDISRE